jgi:hypothetical protein
VCLNTIMQKARGNHCIKSSLGISQESVVHESCCKPILELMKNVYIITTRVIGAVCRKPADVGHSFLYSWIQNI